MLDEKNKIIAQVSSTCTKKKVEDSLAKSIQYKGYKFLFISIYKDAKNLKKNIFKNPDGILFNPDENIFDTKSILNIILDMNIDQQKKFYEFIKKELGNNVDIRNIDSNLATIINVLSVENLDDDYMESPQINSFEIDNKIDFNKLSSIKSVIKEYTIYYSVLDAKYMEFDKQGVNKSISIFRLIRKMYYKLSSDMDEKEAKDLFFDIIEGIKEIVLESRNYREIPYDELDMCVNILVVDAFVRCKIFENPEGYNYATSR